MTDEEEYWDGLDAWSEPEEETSAPLPGGALFEYPPNAMRWLGIGLGIPSFFIIANILLLIGPMGEEGPLAIAVGIGLIALFTAWAIYVFHAFTYMRIYPDRVVFSRKRYDLSDVRWLDVRTAEALSGVVEVGPATIPRFYTYFELVFSVWTPGGTKEYKFVSRDTELDVTMLIERLERLLPNLKVERHMGIEDRTFSPIRDLLDTLLGR
jgi:hypothetical protein